MTRPPRLARALLDRLIAAHLRDAVVGDLDELFIEEHAVGPRQARARYWRRALAAAWHLSGRRPATLARPAVRGDSLTRSLSKDLAHGLRLFVAQPGYAWAAVVTLALAIGANTLIFSIVNLLVVKPLPFEDSDRLGWILASGPSTVEDRAGVSLPDYAVYLEDASSFARLSAWRRHAVTLRVADAAERAVTQTVIGDLHGLWGLAAVRGRTLSQRDEGAAAPPVAVLSHRFWTTRFGGDDDVVGRHVLIDGRDYAVVGVLAPDIELGTMSEIDLWLPELRDPSLASRVERGWRPVGRLDAGRSLADAHAQVSAIAARLTTRHPDTNRGWTARVGSTREAIGGANTWLVLSMLSTVVALLLLLACANIMNLLIARLIGRRQELAVRTALGATRARLVRQIVAESLLIGLGGGLLGLAIAAAGLRAVHGLATEPIFRQLAFDVRVVAFAFGLAVVAPLAFAIVPTLRVLHDDVRAALNDASARSIGGRGATRGRTALVVVQVSLAVTLLIVAGLVVKSVRALTTADLGYDPTPLIATEIDVPAWKVPDERRALQLRQRIIEHVRTIPGVLGVTRATELPALHFPAASSFAIAGREAPGEQDTPWAGVTTVDTSYFGVVGIPVLAGRAFEPADAANARPVVVVSAETARRYWGGPTGAVGALVRLPAAGGLPAAEATVIGVTRDTANPDIDKGADPVMFLLDDHRPVRRIHVVVRADDPGRLAGSLRTAIRDVDPDLPASLLRTVVAGFDDEYSSSRLLGAMFGAFALVAVLLATAGLYGVLSFAVSQRTAEIAVRIALGASSREIAGDVVGRSMRLTIVGVAIGLVGALGLANVMAAALFGVSATDPVIYSGAVVLTVSLAVLASWLPMRRAIHVDPIRSLRQA